jgi:hypothetical protein
MSAERTADWETGNLVWRILGLRRAGGGGARSAIWWVWWLQLGTSARPASACTEAIRALQTFRQIYNNSQNIYTPSKKGTIRLYIASKKGPKLNSF